MRVVRGVEVWRWEEGKGRQADSAGDSGMILSDEHESISSIFSATA